MREWRKKKRSVPEGQDDCVGTAVVSIGNIPAIKELIDFPAALDIHLLIP
jgi:hypothetical protein